MQTLMKILMIRLRRVEIHSSLNCNQLLAEATMKLQRPDGTDFSGMEESDGAEDTAEEYNAENDIEDIAKEIVEYVLGNY